MKKITICLLLLLTFMFIVPSIAQAGEVLWDGKASSVYINGRKMLLGTHPDGPNYHRLFKYETTPANVGWMTREYKNNQTYVYLNLDYSQLQQYYHKTIVTVK